MNKYLVLVHVLSGVIVDRPTDAQRVLRRRQQLQWLNDAREVRYAYSGRRFADAVIHHRRGASRMVSVGGSESIQCHDVTSSHAM